MPLHRYVSALITILAVGAVRDEAEVGEDASTQGICRPGLKCCWSRPNGQGSYSCQSQCDGETGKYQYEAGNGGCSIEELASYLQTGALPVASVLDNFLNHFLKTSPVQPPLVELPLAGDQLDEEHPVYFVVGDLHGALDQLLYVLKRIKTIVTHENKELFSNLFVCKPGVYYVFLGDYVDRGRWNIQTAALVLAYRSLCPRGAILLRGNHDDGNYVLRMKSDTCQEMTQICQAAGLEDSFLIQLFHYAWERLPIAATISKKVFLVHGGLANWLDVEHGYEGFQQSITKARKADLDQLVWNDPRPDQKEEWMPSGRGGSCQWFSGAVIDRFSSGTGLSIVIRGHEVKDRGFSWKGNEGSILTVHTAANLRDHGNHGAFAFLRNGNLEAPFIETHKIAGREIVPVTQGKLGFRSSLLQGGQSSISPLGLDDSQSTDTDPCESIVSPEEELSISNTAKDVLDPLPDDDKAQKALIKIDELGEAALMVNDPQERIHEACKALRTAKAIEAHLKTRGITDEQAATLEDDINEKRALVNRAKGSAVDESLLG